MTEMNEVNRLFCARRVPKHLVAALLFLVCSTGCEMQFGESGLRVIDATNGKPIADVTVYAEYVLEPQPTLLAWLFPGLDHGNYFSICVATRLTSTTKNGAYELSKLTRAQEKYGAEQTKEHQEFNGESTKRAKYKKYYKEGMDVATCKHEKKSSSVVCMSEINGPHEARLERLVQLGSVTCYGEHAMSFNKQLHNEAKSLNVNYQNKRLEYPGTNIGITLGDSYRYNLNVIKNRAYHPDRTTKRNSIFEQVE